MHKRKGAASEGKKLYLGSKFRCPTIFLSLTCTMLSCPAPLSRLHGKYYINGFVQIDSWKKDRSIKIAVE